MNTSGPPSPSPKAHSRRALWLVLVSIVLTSAIIGPALWSLRQQWRPQSNEPEEGIVVEERWRTIHDRTVENGRVYDQAGAELSGATELVLPADRDAPPPGRNVTEEIVIAVRTDGAPGTVRVLLEKRRQYHGHPPESMPLRDLRENLKVWKRFVGTVLVLDVDAGTGTIEGGTTVFATFVVPPKFPLRREPVSAAAFSGRYGNGWRTKAARTKAAGWEEVPQRPLPKSEWPLPLDR